MKNKLIPLLCFFLLCSHDMYLKMDTFFLEPNTESVIDLYNGTFEKSENTIDRDRMLDASLLGNGQRYQLNDDQWTEKDSITKLHFTTGNSGTWVAGISTKPRNIEMNAEAFNKYLKHDGVTDMLKYRSENDLLEQDAIEKYSKHVKAIFQVGNKKTNDWSTALGYPIEFIPISNPYEANTGDIIQVQLIKDGKPLANQLVYADYQPAMNGHTHNDETHTHDEEVENHTHDNNLDAHSHEEENHSHGETSHSHDDKKHSHDEDSNAHNNDHEHTSGQKLLTDANGLVKVKLAADGIWYLRTINLVTTEEEGLTHESNWATLTFEVRHSHDDNDHEHVDEHDHEEEGIPSYFYWIGSILLIVILFFWFNRKK